MHSECIQRLTHKITHILTYKIYALQHIISPHFFLHEQKYLYQNPKNKSKISYNIGTKFQFCYIFSIFIKFIELNFLYLIQVYTFTSSVFSILQQIIVEYFFNGLKQTPTIIFIWFQYHQGNQNKNKTIRQAGRLGTNTNLLVAACILLNLKNCNVLPPTNLVNDKILIIIFDYNQQQFLQNLCQTSVIKKKNQQIQLCC
eukprot:TRINITY_DN1075_c0_g1_i8.p1 TRINITY_DN1075_c0_g1~~TRINITY_DN1075_c0_g1_i8.p1  ORF type:complete len:200 (-),score=-18.30 TRINITY_DN1075_c0_g1_i8:59-658(-)